MYRRFDIDSQHQLSTVGALGHLAALVLFAGAAHTGWMGGIAVAADQSGKPPKHGAEPRNITAGPQPVQNRSAVVDGLQRALQAARDEQAYARRRASGYSAEVLQLQKPGQEAPAIESPESGLKTLSLAMSRLRDAVQVEQLALQDLAVKASTARRLLIEDEAAQMEAASRDVASMAADFSAQRLKASKDISELQAHLVDGSKPAALARRLEDSANADLRRWDDLVQKLESQLRKEQEAQQNESTRSEREIPQTGRGTAPAVTGKTGALGPLIGPRPPETEQGLVRPGRWMVGRSAGFEIDQAVLEVSNSGNRYSANLTFRLANGRSCEFAMNQGMATATALEFDALEVRDASRSGRLHPRVRLDFQANPSGVTPRLTNAGVCQTSIPMLHPADATPPTEALVERRPLPQTACPFSGSWSGQFSWQRSTFFLYLTIQGGDGSNVHARYWSGEQGPHFWSGWGEPSYFNGRCEISGVLTLSMGRGVIEVRPSNTSPESIVVHFTDTLRRSVHAPPDLKFEIAKEPPPR
jgi:hypothetical protein